jgi:hypothetical protein
MSRSRAGLRSHPEVRRGASRRRGIEWERPDTLSWRPAMADDAEWMSGKSRNRLAPVLTDTSSWTSDRSAPDRSQAKPDEVVQTPVATLSGGAASRAIERCSGPSPPPRRLVQSKLGSAGQSVELGC